MLLRPADIRTTAPSHGYIIHDVDAFDYAVFAAAWETSPDDPQWNRRCDISDPNDQTINEFDLKPLTQNWLTTP